MQKFTMMRKARAGIIILHHLTKDKNGLPKMFYHGSKAKGFEVFGQNRDTSGVGFFLTNQTHVAKKYVKDSYLSYPKRFI